MMLQQSFDLRGVLTSICVYAWCKTFTFLIMNQEDIYIVIGGEKNALSNKIHTWLITAYVLTLF